MKKNILICSAVILILSGCTQTNQSKEQLKQTHQNINETSAFLAKLPLKFKGVVSTNNYDSVLLIFTMQPNMEYTLNKEFYKAGKTDSIDNELGNWLIEGENIIHINSANKMPGFNNFKIISDSQIVVVDSLKGDIIDGGNHTLNKYDHNSENQ